jgi:hypothetical protein
MGEHEQLDGAGRRGIRAAVANGARGLAAKHQENGMKRGPVADRWARATHGGFSLSGSYRVRGSGPLKKGFVFFQNKILFNAEISRKSGKCLGTTEKCEIFLKIEWNIWHNFCIENFDQRSMEFK